MSDVIVVGAGHNGLTTAFYLAKAGLKPLVLERRDTVGGAATLAHATGPLRASVARDMQLARRGVQFIQPDPRLIAFAADGRPLRFSVDDGRTAETIREFSERDAARYGEFSATMRRLSGFLAGLLDATPPSLDAPGAGELWDLLKTGRRFRSLGRDDGFRLLRWGPMAVADLVAEWFETDVVQAAIAARGIFGTAQGPWSAGTGAVLLLNSAVDPAPGGSSVTVKGGVSALTAAMADAAREAGAEIRTSADVRQIVVRDGRVAGVALGDGTELQARAVISNADPKRTFLELIDPVDLDPGFLTRVRNYRMPGTTATMTLTLGALPAFRASAADLQGRVHIGPSVDYLERAFDASKYGEVSAEPYLDITFPSIQDPSSASSGRHVMSVYVQFAPFKLAAGKTWDTERATLARNVMTTLEHYAPGITQLVEQQEVLTPADLQAHHGLTGGHILHGEPSLDQLFTMRPFLGWAQYRAPIAGLFLCGAGTHPGGGITAGPGQNAAREILKDLKRRNP